MTMNPASETKQTLLADLISLWQRRRAEGQSVTVDELCRDRPELLPELQKRIAELERMAALADGVQETVTLDPAVVSRVAAAVTDPLHVEVTVDFDGPPQPAAVTARCPDIPGYEILGELGRGGMGVVYKARQTQLNRLVALKMILSGGLADEDELVRFRNEAEAIARLQHGNIVQIHEVGEHDGRPFFSLEFCAGGSLEHKLNGTPLPAQEAAQLVETLAQAMEAAHQAHVIHRDLKPGNVLLTADGTPKVTDFGLAKKLDVQSQTHTGAVMGTPSYMAPEQAGGEKVIGPAADVYALGAILYELLTGRPPFKAATTLDTIMQVVSDEPVPPRRLQSKVPRDLETICLKCLQKQPSRRYASAAALADDLRRFLVGEPILARPVGRLERGWRWCRRNPMSASLSAALLLLLIAVAVGSTVAAIYLNRTANDARYNAEMADEARQKEAAARKIAEDKEEEARKQKEEARKQREQAQLNVYVAEMNLIQRDYEGNYISRVRERLNALVPRWVDAIDYRNFEWYYWHRMAHREVLTLKGHTGFVTSVAFSPDGRRLASASEDKSIRVWDASSGKELLIIKGHQDVVTSVCFSPDGQRLASASYDKSVRVWDAITGKESVILKGHADLVCSVCFSPDGRRLASASYDRTVRLWDPAKGQELLTLQGYTNGVSGVCFNRDGSWMASASSDGTILVWDASTGKKQAILKGHTNTVRGLSFSPDNWRLASASGDATVRTWIVGSGQELLNLKGHTSEVHGVAYSPDGRLLASAGAGQIMSASSDGHRLDSNRVDQTVRVWDAATGKELLTFKGHSSGVTCVSFSPDSRRLASASLDQTIRIWDARIEQDLLTLKGHTSPVWGVSFSRDGRRLVSAGTDRTVRVWDAITGQELLALKGHKEFVTSVSFSPDGRRLASASRDQTVRFWDASAGKELVTFEGHKGSVECACFSPDGRRLASASADQTVRVCDTASGQELTVFEGHTGEVVGVAFSPDGRRLASAGLDRMVRIWDAASGQQLAVLKGHTQGINGVCFSPDGQTLASASSDKTLRLWNATTGQELGILKGHTDRVYGVSFSPDGRRLASASADQTVRIWDTESGRELLTLRDHTIGFKSLSFSPDGRRLASASFHPKVRVWECTALPERVLRQRWLVSQVNSLYDTLLLREEVLTVLRKDASLDETDRRFAVEVAQSHREDPQALNNAVWFAVRDRGVGHIYTLELRRAQAAVRLDPSDPNIIRTLGVTQYRAGLYTDALATLTKSEKLNATKEESHPTDLAFLAMTQHQLGKKDEAKATLTRLRDVMKQPAWVKQAPFFVRFLREAEELIEGKK